MCRNPDLPGPLRSIQRYIQALHCPTRWNIIRCIGTGEKSTKEIYEQLRLGEEMSPAGLYYHLSALKQAGIVGRVCHSLNWHSEGQQFLQAPYVVS